MAKTKRQAKTQPETDSDKWTMTKDETEKQKFLVKGLLKPCSECKRLTHVIHLGLSRLCPDCQPKPKTP